MEDPTAQTPKSADDVSSFADDPMAQTIKPVDETSSFAKERELEERQGKQLAEVIKSSEAADRQAEDLVSKAIEGARHAQPAPKIPADVAASGLKSPQEEANKVVEKGSTLVLPISEEDYNLGLKSKVRGKEVSDTKIVFGVAGIFAFAAWAGRLVKIAHSHMKKVIFRKET